MYRAAAPGPEALEPGLTMVRMENWRDLMRTLQMAVMDRCDTELLPGPPAPGDEDAEIFVLMVAANPQGKPSNYMVHLATRSALSDAGAVIDTFAVRDWITIDRLAPPIANRIDEWTSDSAVVELTLTADDAIKIAERALATYSEALEASDILSERLQLALIEVESAHQATAMAEATIECLERQCQHLGAMLRSAQVAQTAAAVASAESRLRRLARGFRSARLDVVAALGLFAGGVSVGAVIAGNEPTIVVETAEEQSMAQCVADILAAEQVFDELRDAGMSDEAG